MLLIRRSVRDVFPSIEDIVEAPDPILSDGDNGERDEVDEKRSIGGPKGGALLFSGVSSIGRANCWGLPVYRVLGAAGPVYRCVCMCEYI